MRPAAHANATFGTRSTDNPLDNEPATPEKVGTTLVRMTEPIGSSNRALLVTDHRQARLLTDPRSAGFIYPFLGREHSVAEAAREVGCALTTMAYRVRVLTAAALLIVTRRDERAGRPITYYQSSSDSYRVPLTATDFLDARDQTRRIGAPIQRRLNDAYSAVLARDTELVRTIARDDHGDIYSSDQPPHRTSDRQPLIFEDRHIYLSVHRAERLCTELDRLLGELSNPHTDEPDTGPRQPYLIMIAALPAARQ